jgi:uncharacterized BrkB/YihY/UPF0761 family membrane protein
MSRLRVQDGAMADPIPDETAPAAEARPPGVVARMRTRGEDVGEQAKGWLDRRRLEAMPVDLAVQYYERDRDSFASVLGAAIALRLFLFFVPALLTMFAVVMLIGGHDSIKTISENAGVTGGLAAQVDEATQTTRTTNITLLVGGLWLLLWSGRSLTKVLASCSAGAWRMAGREGKATLRMAASVTTLVLAVVFTAAVMNRVRVSQGLAVVTTSWLVAGVIYGVAWFLVCSTLPRRTSDPGALLPGAVVTGAALTGLQWFVQFYLPAKLDGVTALAGGVGTAVVTLGYMFLIGRVMATSFILDAVVYERIGSVSELVFALPGLRRLPQRSPRLRHYFDLDGDGGEVAGGEDVPPDGAASPGA